jgi:hypothetical protein
MWARLARDASGFAPGLHRARLHPLRPEGFNRDLMPVAVKGHCTIEISAKAASPKCTVSLDNRRFGKTEAVVK